jgi:hypothetical protein
MLTSTTEACQSDDQEMPSWEEILDAPEQYLVLDDSLSELNLGEPATMDIDTVFRLTMMIFARQTLGDVTLPLSFRDQSGEILIPNGGLYSAGGDHFLCRSLSCPCSRYHRRTSRVSPLTAI